MGIFKSVVLKRRAASKCKFGIVLIGLAVLLMGGFDEARSEPFTLSHTFNDPTVSDCDFFGFSVALDGDSVLIGAHGDDTNGTNVGQAHLFSSTTGGLLQTFDNPTVSDRDFFGFSVALDGDNVLIGAYRDDTNGTNVGQAHLFSSTTGALLQTFNDPTVTGGNNFGISVALDGNNVLIGGVDNTTAKNPSNR